MEAGGPLEPYQPNDFIPDGNAQPIRSGNYIYDQMVTQTDLVVPGDRSGDNGSEDATSNIGVPDSLSLEDNPYVNDPSGADSPPPPKSNDQPPSPSIWSWSFRKWAWTGNGYASDHDYELAVAEGERVFGGHTLSGGPSAQASTGTLFGLPIGLHDSYSRGCIRRNGQYRLHYLRCRDYARDGSVARWGMER